MSSRSDKIIKTDKVVYSDFTISLAPNPDTKQLFRVTNENAVKRSIKSLLLTNQYERLFQPDIGGNLLKILFENSTAQTTQTLTTFITKTIDNYEPRAKIISVDVQSDDANHSYMVSLYFYIVGKTAPVSYSLILDRVR